ncbi:hypothetical protein KBC75_01295 [Candidatus Shapirobacteria bacterium]|nr:hypothetical protein [Candidatus Shapirobacteria bacterium]
MPGFNRKKGEIINIFATSVAQKITEGNAFRRTDLGEIWTSTFAPLCGEVGNGTPLAILETKVRTKYYELNKHNLATRRTHDGFVTYDPTISASQVAFEQIQHNSSAEKTQARLKNKQG